MERRLIDLWEGTFQDVVALELLRRGKEITLLGPPVATPRAANLLLDRMVASPEPPVREAAAALAGLLAEHAPLDVLDRLFAPETESVHSDPLRAANAQENVRGIVFEAARSVAAIARALRAHALPRGGGADDGRRRQRALDVVDVRHGDADASRAGREPRAARSLRRVGQR